MINYSTQSNDYLWYLILLGKRKENITKTHPNTKTQPPPPHFQWSEQKMSLPVKFDCVAESVERQVSELRICVRVLHDSEAVQFEDGAVLEELQVGGSDLASLHVQFRSEGNLVTEVSPRPNFKFAVLQTEIINIFTSLYNHFFL